VGNRLDIYVNAAAPPAYTITAFSHTAGVREVGQSVSGFSLNWTFSQGNIDPTTQSINQGIGSLAANLRTVVVAAPITADTTYTLSASKAPDAPSAQTTVVFQRKRYWGVSPNADLITAGVSTYAALSAALENFQQEFATVRQTTKTFDCSAGDRYVYFFMPASFGTVSPEIMSGVFPVVLSYVQTFSFTNASGHTESYRVYRGNNPQNSSNVTWSIL
jgi:hypothetical protein